MTDDARHTLDSLSLSTIMHYLQDNYFADSILDEMNRWDIEDYVGENFDMIKEDEKEIPDTIIEWMEGLIDNITKDNKITKEELLKKIKYILDTHYISNVI